MLFHYVKVDFMIWASIGSSRFKTQKRAA